MFEYKIINFCRLANLMKEKEEVDKQNEGNQISIKELQVRVTEYEERDI